MAANTTLQAFARYILGSATREQLDCFALPELEGIYTTSRTTAHCSHHDDNCSTLGDA